MPWNWQLPDWPKFRCNPSPVAHLERQFLLNVGRSCAFLKNSSSEEQNQFANR